MCRPISIHMYIFAYVYTHSCILVYINTVIHMRIYIYLLHNNAEKYCIYTYTDIYAHINIHPYHRCWIAGRGRDCCCCCYLSSRLLVVLHLTLSGWRLKRKSWGRPPPCPWAGAETCSPISSLQMYIHKLI